MKWTVVTDALTPKRTMHKGGPLGGRSSAGGEALGTCAKFVLHPAQNSARPLPLESGSPFLLEFLNFSPSYTIFSSYTQKKKENPVKTLVVVSAF